MKKLITLTILALIVLCGCSVETSSTTTTSTTINGHTTTTTTTTENGQTSTETITYSDDDPTGLRSKWTEYFVEGAEGVSADNYNIYFAYDDPESITFAAMMILNSDNSELLTYVFGEVVPEDDHFKIVDVEGEEELPFEIVSTDVDGGFELAFKDGDSVVMNFVDQATIINDMISLWEIHQEAYQAQ